MNVKTVIVTWNQTALTSKCLASLDAAGLDLATVWVVDNASAVPVADELCAVFPAVHYLRLEINIGFAGGCNVGVEHALASDNSCEAIFLLNNDAEIEPQTLSELMQVLASDSTIAAVSPKVYYAGSNAVIQSTGLTVDRNSGQSRMVNTDAAEPLDREALFGCAMLIRTDVWQASGGFWQPFFNYAEETDWCVRVRRAGWRLVYVPSAIVWHNTSSSLGWNSPLKAYLITRNQWWLRERHNTGGLAAWRGWLYACYILARTAFRYVRHGQFRQAQALWFGTWDYWQRRTGNTRTRTLERVRTP